MSRILVIIFSLAATTVLSGCGFFLPQFGLAPDGSAAAETNLTKFRAAVAEKPGEYGPAAVFAAFAISLQSMDTTLDERAVAKEAVGYLDAVTEEENMYAALADKGGVLNATGEKKPALEAYRASLEAKQSVQVLPEMLKLLADDSAEIIAVCEGIREAITSDAEVYTLMEHCALADDPLDWASADDVAMFKREHAAAERRRAEREAQRQAEAERMQASMSQPSSSSNSGSGSGSSGSSGSSGPQPYSARVSVYNACKQKVRIFRGRVSNNNTGSGTNGWHSSNSTSSYSLSGDDELCIVGDNGRDILSCTKPQQGASLQITKSCSGFSRR